MIWLWLACSTPEVPEVPQVPQVAEAPAQVEPPAPPDVPAEPAGPSIGGHPILPHTIVLGAISTQAVDDAVAAERSAVTACADGRTGTMLVQLNLGPDGAVVKSELKSTTLRHPETEACVVEALGAVRFPALERGELAIVKLPVVLP